MMDSVAEGEIGMEADEAAAAVVVVVVDDSTRTEGVQHRTELCPLRRGRRG